MRKAAETMFSRNRKRAMTTPEEKRQLEEVKGRLNRVERRVEVLELQQKLIKRGQ